MARKNDYLQKVDLLLGERIYSLRLAKGLSRQQLAEMIDITHQQLQKYEKGVNRISIGRLILIAKALDTEIEHFFQDIDDVNNVTPPLTQHQRMCIEVSRNFMKIINAAHQKAVNSLIHTLVKEQE